MGKAFLKPQAGEQGARGEGGAGWQAWQATDKPALVQNSK